MLLNIFARYSHRNMMYIFLGWKKTSLYRAKVGKPNPTVKKKND
jgi:hypothetical protein